MSELELSRDAWNQLLRALDPDAARAASRYEQLRNRLIALYRWRELPCPEDLADAALDHVACRLLDGALVQAEVDRHVRGVAGQIADRARRRRRRERTLDPTALPERPAGHEPGRDADEPLARLCRCLDELPRSERRTLLDYETGTARDRVHRRKALAAELGIPLNALRVRIHRLRARVVAMMGDDDAAQPRPAARRDDSAAARRDHAAAARREDAAAARRNDAASRTSRDRFGPLRLSSDTA